MIKLTIAEFDDLLYTATFLKYYWCVFCGMNDCPEKAFPHTDFVLDFIENEELSNYASVKRNSFNKVLISNEELYYLEKCSAITNELKCAIFDKDKPS